MRNRSACSRISYAKLRILYFSSNDVVLLLLTFDRQLGRRIQDLCNFCSILKRDSSNQNERMIFSFQNVMVHQGDKSKMKSVNAILSTFSDVISSPMGGVRQQLQGVFLFIHERNSETETKEV